MSPTPCLVDPRQSKTVKGYARSYWRSPSGKRYFLAHSGALARALGRDILPGHHAAHRCGNPACFRVGAEHVYEATPKQNEADKRRPRVTRPVEFALQPATGWHKHAGKVVEIRARADAREPIKAIARALDLPVSSVRDIARRESYPEGAA